MSVKRQRGSKAQRQNQHVRKLMMKLDKFTRKGWSTEGLEKEISYCAGDKVRPLFQTGRMSDPRYRNYKGDVKDL